MATIEMGLDTFGDVTVDADGRPKSHAQVLRDIVTQAELADQLGVDFLGVGEHHRPDFAISAPEVLLAAIAGRTGRIRLGTAVTILSTDDPVRVYQRFSTLDAVSGGRAEVILGRGSFTESFPLFGHSFEDYDALFEEKLAIFAAIRDADRTGEPVRWKGTVRPPLEGVRIFPPVEHPPLAAWVGVGGSPESVVRAARYRFPLTLAIIGGDTRRFAPYVELYHRALAQFGHPPLPVGVHSPGHIADSDVRAREELWPAYEVMRNRIGAERGWPPTSRAEFDREIAAGSLYVGSPETVARKIAATMRALGASRFDLKYSNGTLRHELMLRSIELYGHAMTVPLSVLDLAPIVEGGGAAQALHRSLDLARHAERLGYRRFWLAEHHGMPGIASAATAVVIGHVAAGTSTIRVGAGGIMLPNHAPLVIAEQFGTLASLYPGRIDLGVGRAPGSDQLTTRALRRSPMAAETFPEDVVELMNYFRPPHRDEGVRAVPGAGLDVPIWILGSSLFGAQLAAELGLPYAFASHFAPAALFPALELYRRRFKPSDRLERPYVMLGVNVFAAETDAEGRRLFTSLQQAFVNLRRGHPSPLPPPDDTFLERLPPGERRLLDDMLSCSVVGSPETVRRGLEGFAERTGADELMLTSQIYDHDARLRSL